MDDGYNFPEKEALKILRNALQYKNSDELIHFLDIDFAAIETLIKANEKYKFLIDHASSRLEYYLIDNAAVENNPENVQKEFNKLLKILKGEYYKYDK